MNTLISVIAAIVILMNTTYASSCMEEHVDECIKIETMNEIFGGGKK